jgi:hypothetical protein
VVLVILFLELAPFASLVHVKLKALKLSKTNDLIESLSASNEVDYPASISIFNNV